MSTGSEFELLQASSSPSIPSVSTVEGLSSSRVSGISEILESGSEQSERSDSGTLIERESDLTVRTAHLNTSAGIGLLETEYNGKIAETAVNVPREFGETKFNELYRRWFGNTNEYHERTVYEITELALQNFGLKNKRITHEILEDCQKKALYSTLKLMQWYRKNGLYNSNSIEFGTEYSILFNKIIEVIYYSKQCIASMLRIQIAMNPDYDSTMNTDPGLFKFEGYDLKTNSPFQVLVLYLLRYLHENQLRRYNNSVYKMRFIHTENDNKHFSYSWKEMFTIKQLVYNLTSKEVNYHQWKNATHSKSNISDAVKYLENCKSEEFPELVKDRHVFSFKNGVYITNNKNKKTGKYTDFFYSYKNKAVLDSGVVAAKYFDIEFDNFSELSLGEWDKIPTPNFDKILNYQFSDNSESSDIIKWMYILMGKLLYNVRDLEGWQIMPYLMGVAGSGKSTICEIAKLFYEAPDIGILENNIEEKFGLAPLANRYIVLAPEIKKSFSLDQALFQKIISGEKCALPQKNILPLEKVWIAPMFMASNEPPGFADAAGSISRRLIVFKFLKIVKAKDSDPQLMQKLELEIGAIIKKSNMAYLDTVNRFGKKDIWSIIPNYFRTTRDMLGQETNTLKHFLGSGNFVFGDNLYCPEKEFKDRYKQYCIENGFTKATWSPAVYEGPLAEIGNNESVEIRLVKGTKKYPPVDGQKKTVRWIEGFDFIPDNDNDNDKTFT